MGPMTRRSSHVDVDLLAALLRPPDERYLALVERARLEAVPASPEAARHFQHFAERVRALDEPELEELYRESFVPADAVALRHAADQMRQSGCPACGRALPVLERLLGPLEAARNPFAVLFKAICFAMPAPKALEAPEAPSFPRDPSSC